MTDGAIADLVTLEIVKGETSLTWGGRFATLADKTQGWGYNDVQRRAEAQARETMADAVQKSGDSAEAKVNQKLQRTNSTRVGGKALRMQQVNRVVVRVKPAGAICRCPPLSCLLGRHPDPIQSDMPQPLLLGPLSVLCLPPPPPSLSAVRFVRWARSAARRPRGPSTWSRCRRRRASASSAPTRRMASGRCSRSRPPPCRSARCW
jgi:hypothetical protein